MICLTQVELTTIILVTAILSLIIYILFINNQNAKNEIHIHNQHKKRDNVQIGGITGAHGRTIGAMEI